MGGRWERIYVGMASQLRQVVHGTRMDRAYGAYTYLPASKVVQINSPRVRVYGLLNRSIGGIGDVVVA